MEVDFKSLKRKSLILVCKRLSAIDNIQYSLLSFKNKKLITSYFYATFKTIEKEDALYLNSINHTEVMIKLNRDLLLCANGNSLLTINVRKMKVIRFTKTDNWIDSMLKLSKDLFLVFMDSRTSPIELWDIKDGFLPTMQQRISIKTHNYIQKFVSPVFWDISKVAIWDQDQVMVLQFDEEFKTLIKAENLLSGCKSFCPFLIKLSRNRLAMCKRNPKNTISIVNLKSKEDKLLVGHTSYITFIGKVSSVRLVSTSNDKTIKTWNLKTYECIDTIILSKPCISLVFMKGCNSFAFCEKGENGSLKLYNLERKKINKIKTGNEEDISILFKVGRDDLFVITATSLTLFGIAEAKLHAKGALLVESINSIGKSFDSQRCIERILIFNNNTIITSGSNGMLCSWKLDNGGLLKSLNKCLCVIHMIKLSSTRFITFHIQISQVESILSVWDINLNGFFKVNISIIPKSIIKISANRLAMIDSNTNKIAVFNTSLKKFEEGPPEVYDEEVITILVRLNKKQFLTADHLFIKVWVSSTKCCEMVFSEMNVIELLPITFFTFLSSAHTKLKLWCSKTNSCLLSFSHYGDVAKMIRFNSLLITSDFQNRTVKRSMKTLKIIEENYEPLLNSLVIKIGPYSILKLKKNEAFAMKRNLYSE